MDDIEQQNFGCSTTENNEARAYLDHLLNDGCKDLDYNQTEMSLPVWYDKKLFARGQSYAAKYRLILFGGMVTGLIAVLSVPTILKVLICTRRSSNPAMAYRRYLRTILHVLSWYQYKLKAGSKSWKSIEMVRNRHHNVSQKCQNQLNIGITQKDLALTQFGFIGFSSLSAAKIGINDIAFHESTIHMWRVIGYLLGIKDEYNLCTNSWLTTKKRLIIVMNEVYKPALENTNDDFNKVTKNLIEGLWPINTTIGGGWDTAVFTTKSSAKCKGYEYYSTDNFGDTTIKHKEYYKLNIFKRFMISFILFKTNKLYKYTLIRWYMNFLVWLGELMMCYLPFLAIYKYGCKWAYVRIFTHNEEKYNRD